MRASDSQRAAEAPLSRMDGSNKRNHCSLSWSARFDMTVRGHGRQNVGPSQCFVVRSVRAETDAEVDRSDAQTVAGQQYRAQDSLSVHFRSVGADQVAHRDHVIPLKDDAVHLRDASMIDVNVALLVATHDRYGLLKFDPSFAIQGN